MKKNGTIVKLNDSWIMYNEDKPKIKDIVIDADNDIKKLQEYNSVSGLARCYDGTPFILDGSKKLIASETSREGLTLLDKNQIEEQINREDLDELAKEDFNSRKTKFASIALEQLAIIDWKRGFNKHAESTKDKLFTLVDMQNAISKAYDKGVLRKQFNFLLMDEIIDSLQQLTYYQVEYETEYAIIDLGFHGSTISENLTLVLTNGYLHVKIIK